MLFVLAYAEEGDGGKGGQGRGEREGGGGGGSKQVVDGVKVHVLTVPGEGSAVHPDVDEGRVDTRNLSWSR